MEFRILGPLEVLVGDRSLALGGSRQRALLAVLLLHANETLSTDALLDELWSQRPPATAAKTVQVHVSRLRKALAAGGFLEQTPLWFYVLREAEIRGGGNHLGETGSRIVAETIVGLLKGDPTSYLNADTPWDPSQGVLLDDGRQIRTIRDFLQFSGIPA